MTTFHFGFSVWDSDSQHLKCAIYGRLLLNSLKLSLIQSCRMKVGEEGAIFPKSMKHTVASNNLVT